jgi:hypothetical protein
MANDYFQDVPEGSSDSGSSLGQNKSIRNISVSSRQRAPKKVQSASRVSGVSSRRGGGSKSGIWFVAIISIIALVGAGFFVFRGTSVTVTPREQTVVFDEQALYTAYPKGQEAGAGSIVYETISREFEESISVEASSVESVEDNASGKITVVNNHSDASLRLIKNTRFETPTGLIYRIRSSVVVPGKKGDKAGELEVTVYADESGERYNIGPIAKFTLPGLKTTGPEMFSNVYARSDRSISGGFVGERPVVSESDLESAKSQLRARLEEQALAAFEDAGSNDLYVFPELLDISYESVAPDFAEDGSVRVREIAVATVPAFEGGAFAKSIAEATSADAGSGEIKIADPTSFTISLIDAETVEIGKDVLDFTLSGSAVFIWAVDSGAISRDLAGKSKESFQSILESHPGVEESSAQIRPFWKGTFPKDAEDIKVVIISSK